MKPILSRVQYGTWVKAKGIIARLESCGSSKYSAGSIYGSRIGLFNQSSQFIIKDTTINVIGGDQYNHSNDMGSAKATEWITAPDPLENFNTAYLKIVENTGTWLLEDRSFQNWKNNGNLLWLQGKAGSGKTFLCTNIINNLRKTNTVVFYYFDTRDQAKVNYDGFVSSLLCQVAGKANNEHAQAKLQTLYTSSQGGNFLVAEDKGAILIDLIMTIDKAIYIVIDGVDESSRPHLNMASIAAKKNITISLNNKSGVNADIERYVDIQLEQSSFSEELKTEIKTALVNGGNGQIRWVDCQWTEIKEIVVPDEIREALRSLPSTLEETYAKILEKIKSQTNVKKLLQWLIYSYRALSIEEVEDILAVNLDKETYSIGNRPHNLETQLHKLISSTLLIITKIEKWWNTSTEVQLAHPSVKEYLLSNMVIQSASGYFQMNSALAHKVIGQTCLVYLLCCGKVAIDIKKFPLASYAAQYWFLHFHQTPEKSQAILNLIIRLLNMTEPTYGNWLTLYTCTADIWNNESAPTSIAQLLYYASVSGLKSAVVYMLEHNDVKMHGEVDDLGGEYGNALQAASILGHLEIVGALLENRADVNAKGGHYGNALQAASHGGHLEVVKVLLENGADINAEGRYYGNALQAASHRGYLEIVKVLLENRADINAKGGYYGSALQAANHGGHVEVLKVLLENGADINAPGGIYVNALQAAIHRGHLEVVKELLKHGTDVNAQCGYYGNALQAASTEGYLKVVKVLLENRADVNAQGGYYGNALQAASNGGHLEVVKVLLKHGAHANAQGGHYGNALYIASTLGHLEIVRVLLENRADANAQGGFYGNALQAASNGGHLEVVKVLLEHGAHANAQGGHYGNALYIASTLGHLEIVKVLLENRADVNPQGSNGSALYAASNEGHLKVVKVLLENRADVNAQGGYYGNALNTASLAGHLEVVKVLLQNRADVNAQAGLCGTALHAASTGGHVEVVKVLLENRADVNAEVHLYGNALKAASRLGHLKVVAVLLESGADVNAQDRSHENALQVASHEGHLEVVKALLENRADVNAQDGYYGNALQAASHEGHLEVVKVLLENGADVNAQGGYYGNALQAARCGRYLEVVKVLLENRADVNAQGGTYGSALQAARHGSHPTVVKVLLENQADDVEDESMEMYYSCDEF
ncbi:hypothetical protein D9758_016589 [Tetrapyrgos nigripes]|uniref:NACHT domain-containing protein n=1 Tax=Tetrapyrgos nigripes TaxID=182062 RepID=A0A8H5FEM6_9AGAR|nr:hypothetical protein D9758_016589 [Tetrapyrgos nigripes]